MPTVRIKEATPSWNTSKWYSAWEAHNAYAQKIADKLGPILFRSDTGSIKYEGKKWRIYVKDEVWYLTVDNEKDFMYIMMLL
jgi:hypothetical protein